MPPFWQTIALFNPVYLVSGFRWSFHGTAAVGLALSLGMTFAFLVVSWLSSPGPSAPGIG